MPRMKRSRRTTVPGGQGAPEGRGSPPPERRELGQGLIEYGLLLGLISIAAIATLLLLGDQLRRVFGDTLAYLIKFG